METSSNQQPIPLWIDTDPSGLVWTGLDCDDDLAVLVALALHRRGILDLRGISVCGGNAPLQHTWPDIHRLLDHAGANQSIALSKGYGWRSMQVAGKSMPKVVNRFLDTDDSQDATNSLIELAQQSASSPIKILMLGPPTNLARAIEQGLILSGVHHVFLMGGEMTGQQMDLNFRSDRGAARIVIESELPTTIIPIQTGGQTSVTQSYLDRLDCPKQAVCALLPKMKLQVQVMPHLVNPAVQKRFLHEDDPNSRWKASPNLDYGFVPWDVVALFAITHPDELFDEWEYHRVAMPSCSTGEPCDQTMQILEDLGTQWDEKKNWSGVVRVPHLVRNETQLLETMFSYLAEIPAAYPEPPPLLNGFLNVAVALCVGFVSFLLWLFRSF
jgi:inosine-uridine nucleoside N-ribohydrolase